MCATAIRSLKSPSRSFSACWSGEGFGCAMAGCARLLRCEVSRLDRACLRRKLEYPHNMDKEQAVELIRECSLSEHADFLIEHLLPSARIVVHDHPGSAVED